MELETDKFGGKKVYFEICTAESLKYCGINVLRVHRGVWTSRGQTVDKFTDSEALDLRK